MKMGTQLPEPVGHSKGNLRREVCRYEHVCQEIISQIYNLMMYLKLLEKQEQGNPKVVDRKK
jgi:hypothetical protein